MRLFALSFYHWVFERAVRFYAGKKNARYLIDGIGQNIKKGRFPKELLTDVEYVDFGDMQAPIPKGYDAYLRHFYGDRYMELLPAIIWPASTWEDICSAIRRMPPSAM